jgi:hypothetical protein
MHRNLDTNTATCAQSTLRYRYRSASSLFAYLFPRHPILLPQVPAPEDGVDNPFRVDPDWLLQLGRPPQ